MLLHERDAAEYLGMSVSWIQRSRWDGTGPKFVKFSNAVRYRKADLDEYIEARIIHSTSQKER